MSSFPAALQRIKGDICTAVPAALIPRAVAVLGLTGRDRILTPMVTAQRALRRAWLAAKPGRVRIPRVAR